MLRHGSVGILLNEQLDVAFLIGVACGCVRSNSRLLLFRALEFCDDSGCHIHARDLVRFRQLEYEALGVVIVVLRLFQLEIDESLIATKESLLIELLALLLCRRCSFSIGLLVAEE